MSNNTLCSLNSLCSYVYNASPRHFINSWRHASTRPHHITMRFGCRQLNKTAACTTWSFSESCLTCVELRRYITLKGGAIFIFNFSDIQIIVLLYCPIYAENFLLTRILPRLYISSQLQNFRSFVFLYGCTQMTHTSATLRIVKENTDY